MKPRTYDAMLRVRLPKELLAELAASTPDVAKKVRALIAQYLKKRAGERAKAPVAVPDDEALP